mmetsp:Transcript_19857/g.38916  ORF Transcript_19857/g.38916 Transcript_19857/m.38916 type:complete len:328 (-) Transcript_19857:176-1159(-)
MRLVALECLLEAAARDEFVCVLFFHVHAADLAFQGVVSDVLDLLESACRLGLAHGKLLELRAREACPTHDEVEVWPHVDELQVGNALTKHINHTHTFGLILVCVLVGTLAGVGCKSNNVVSDVDLVIDSTAADNVVERGEVNLVNLALPEEVEQHAAHSLHVLVLVKVITEKHHGALATNSLGKLGALKHVLEGLVARNTNLHHIECLVIVNAAKYDVVGPLLRVRGHRENAAVVLVTQKLHAGLVLEGKDIVLTRKQGRVISPTQTTEVAEQLKAERTNLVAANQEALLLALLYLRLTILTATDHMSALALTNQRLAHDESRLKWI